MCIRDRQKEAAIPAMIAHLEEKTRHGTPIVAHVAAGGELIAKGVVRYVHAQRSCLEAHTEHALLWACGLGKAREGDTRPGFMWTVPLAGVSSFYDKSAFLAALLGPRQGDNPAWCLYDYGPKKAGILQAEYFINRKLPYNKFVSAMRTLYENGLVSLSKEQIDAVSTYVLRRVGPSCAGCLLYTSPSPRDRTRSRMPSSA